MISGFDHRDKVKKNKEIIPHLEVYLNRDCFALLTMTKFYNKKIPFFKGILSYKNRNLHIRFNWRTSTNQISITKSFVNSRNGGEKFVVAYPI